MSCEEGVTARYYYWIPQEAWVGRGGAQSDVFAFGILALEVVASASPTQLEQAWTLLFESEMPKDEAFSAIVDFVEQRCRRESTQWVDNMLRILIPCLEPALDARPGTDELAHSWSPVEQFSRRATL